MPMPRARTGGPRFDKDRAREIAHDWWEECKAILQAACPLIMVPSPIREALAA